MDTTLLIYLGGFNYITLLPYVLDEKLSDSKTFFLFWVLVKTVILTRCHVTRGL
jgi:hypothetical protein